jgi:exopolysaccharide production protein ExoY
MRKFSPAFALQPVAASALPSPEPESLPPRPWSRFDRGPEPNSPPGRSHHWDRSALRNSSDLLIAETTREFALVLPLDATSTFEPRDAASITVARLWTKTARGVDRAATRALDLLVASVLLLLALPAMVAIVLAIVATSPGGVIFRQVRGGRRGRPFVCLKFRTMVPDAEAVLDRDEALRTEFAASRKLERDPRMTPIGRWLRRTSLDELPQLLNVLRGEMSLVGPRPVPLDELRECYGDLADRAFAVNPGLTGLWQVSGRSDVTYDARIALDLEYAARRNVLVDFGLILRTVPVVLARRGAK